MTQEPTKCCEKCCVSRGPNGEPYCGNRFCECHQQSEPKEWEEEFDKKYDLTHVANLDEGYFCSMDEVKDFIRTLITKARREGERDGEKKGLEGAVKAVQDYKPHIGKDGWLIRKYVIEAIRKRIEEL